MTASQHANTHVNGNWSVPLASSGMHRTKLEQTTKCKPLERTLTMVLFCYFRFPSFEAQKPKKPVSHVAIVFSIKDQAQQQEKALDI